MLNRFYILIYVCLCCFSATYADDSSLVTHLARLDSALAASLEIVAAYEQSINDMKNLLSKASDDKSKYVYSYNLYEHYRAFVNDSAIYYLQQCIAISSRMGDQQQADYCRAKLAFQCSSTGMFHESLDVLSQIDPKRLAPEGLIAYYEAYRHVYGELSFYTRLPDLQQQYYDKINHYEQLLYQTAPADNDIVLQCHEMNAMNENRLDDALRYNDQRMKAASKGSHQYAIVSFYRYLDFSRANQADSAAYWLLESAISDVKNAVMDQGSMWELANHLQAEGNTQQSYRYISFASDCANRFGTRVRNWQIAPILSTIDKNYQQQTRRSNRQLRWLLGGISALTLLVLASLLFVSRQRKQLAVAHDQLNQSNQKLSSVNRQLSDSNGQLTELNSQLSTLNAHLTESNRVKEEYVGRFLQMCSLYIDKMDKMRKTVNKKIKSHEYEDLYNMTRSQEMKDKDLEELYENFDSAFLHLFPNFVADFNALLRPEERIVPGEKERLNTGIRIFALIRLGIDDSSKIAEFLHYSVNTIYNYRARIKNGALSDRENFEKHVKEIGLPRQ